MKILNADDKAFLERTKYLLSHVNANPDRHVPRLVTMIDKLCATIRTLDDQPPDSRTGAIDRFFPVPIISMMTGERAVAIHKIHAGPSVGAFGSDADIRFFALALAGEAGELANVVKKAWRDGKPLNREAALEELAGTACYLVGMAAALECDLDTEMNHQMTLFEMRPRE